MVLVPPNTQSTINATDQNRDLTSTGLSTQIIIMVNDNPVGALQSLSVSQRRGLARVRELGTDGVIEIIPNAPTEFDLRASRVVFDQLRLPEAFSRGFRMINAQRIPFTIKVFDIGKTSANAEIKEDTSNIVVMTYEGCWFTSYETPYNVDNYVITETADIWAETGYVSEGATGLSARSLMGFETDSDGVETSVNEGERRGSLDVGGLFDAVFDT